MRVMSLEGLVAPLGCCLCEDCRPNGAADGTAGAADDVGENEGWEWVSNEMFSREVASSYGQSYGTGLSSVLALSNSMSSNGLPVDVDSVKGPAWLVLGPFAWLSVSWNRSEAVSRLF